MVKLGCAPRYLITEHSYIIMGLKTVVLLFMTYGTIAGIQSYTECRVDKQVSTAGLYLQLTSLCYSV